MVRDRLSQLNAWREASVPIDYRLFRCRDMFRLVRIFPVGRLMWALEVRRAARTRACPLGRKFRLVFVVRQLAVLAVLVSNRTSGSSDLS